MSARVLVCLALVCASCAEAGDDAVRRQAIEDYAAYGHRTYAATVEAAHGLRAEVDAFVLAPSEPGLQRVRQAWLDAREPYGLSEVLRFSDGPIEEVEGRLNGWPMDEAYIDYVQGTPDSGIINDPTIELSKDQVAGLNEGGQGEVVGVEAHADPSRAISTGYHAIEFLLWGQDHRLDGPGTRSHLDFVTTMDATAPNGDRRARYLELVTDLLVDDLEGVAAQWVPAEDNYRQRFEAGSPSQRLETILTSLGIFAKAEVGGERIDVALSTRDQEDEHSCFSDNTHRDLQLNVAAIVAVYRGDIGGGVGPGIEGVVAREAPELNQEIIALLDELSSTAEALPNPIDRALVEESPRGRQQMDALVDLLFEVGDRIADVGAALGLGTFEVALPQEPEDAH